MAAYSTGLLAHRHMSVYGRLQINDHLNLQDGRISMFVICIIQGGLMYKRDGGAPTDASN